MKESAGDDAAVCEVPREPAAPVHRTYYRVSDDANEYERRRTGHSFEKENPEHTTLVDELRRGTIGHNAVFTGPYGNRRVLYCDFVASGRALAFIEDYIRHEVLPLYGNTHTTTSLTGRQTTLFRREARDIVKRSVHGSDKDVVVFCGSGCTAAVHKVIHCMGLRRTEVEAAEASEPVAQTPPQYDNYYHHIKDNPSTIQPGATRVPLAVQFPSREDVHTPIVFVGPHEHHSNLLSWRESTADVVNIRESADGTLDRAHLAEMLDVFAARKLKVGSFSAASNVTGVLESVDEVTKLLHEHGALAFWDYAAAGPYVEIDMNPKRSDAAEQRLLQKDAVFLSPHKFLGGPQTPGVLVAKKHIIDRSVTPEHAGGGTVFYVTENDHRYVANREEREEGGTPGIVEAIRCGLVFRVKEMIGIDWIREREHAMITRAMASWRANPNIHILGDVESQAHPSMQRLSIVSFLLSIEQTGYHQHYNFTSALLNDLFGIQTRGGCACAGPYAQTLLGLTWERAKAYEGALLERTEMLRPGFCRLNFHYLLTDAEFEYVVDAVHFCANEGWKLMPQYRFSPDSGEWTHRDDIKFAERRWLHDLSFVGGMPKFATRSIEQSATDAANLAAHAAHAAPQIVRAFVERVVDGKVACQDQVVTLSEEEQCLRWFAFPSEAFAWLTAGLPAHRHTNPFCMPAYGAVPLAEVVRGAAQRSREAAAEAAAKAVANALTAAEGDGGEAAPKPKLSKAEAKRQKKFMKDMSSRVGRAIRDYSMIEDGDRILVGVSGGKDSLTLVHMLLRMQRRAPIHFDIGCCTVDPQTPEFNPKPLIKYFEELGIPFFYESQPIIEQAACSIRSRGGTQPSICAWCARMKRGVLYTTARREGYNVLALGQHCDDLCESLVMSIFYNGLLRTMKANYVIDEGDLRVIRPLIYVRESMTRQFSVETNLPVIEDNCPACFVAPTERFYIKKLLAEQEIRIPALFSSILRSLKPLMETDINRDVSYGRRKQRVSEKKAAHVAAQKEKSAEGE